MTDRKSRVLPPLSINDAIKSAAKSGDRAVDTLTILCERVKLQKQEEIACAQEALAHAQEVLNQHLKQQEELARVQEELQQGLKQQEELARLKEDLAHSEEASQQQQSRRNTLQNLSRVHELLSGDSNMEISFYTPMPRILDGSTSVKLSEVDAAELRRKMEEEEKKREQIEETFDDLLRDLNDNRISATASSSSSTASEQTDDTDSNKSDCSGGITWQEQLKTDADLTLVDLRESIRAGDSKRAYMLVHRWNSNVSTAKPRDGSTKTQSSSSLSTSSSSVSSENDSAGSKSARGVSTLRRLTLRMRPSGSQPLEEEVKQEETDRMRRPSDAQPLEKVQQETTPSPRRDSFSFIRKSPRTWRNSDKPTSARVRKDSVSSLVKPEQPEFF